MSEELIKKAQELFNCEEKWNSFLELASLKETIITNWNLKLKQEILKKIKLDDVWELNKNGYGVQWYLKQFGPNSISIWLEGERFSIWAEKNVFDNELINKKLKEPKYQSIYNGILNKDKIFDGSYFFGEKGRFEFDSVHDNDFDSNRLAWFAGNKTDEYIEQIKIKLEPFIGIESIKLLIELNNLGKVNVV